MKKLIAPSLLAVVLVSGCSAPAAETKTPATAAMPGPDAAHQKTLMVELDKVNPKFGDRRGTVNARLVCRSMLTEPDAAQVIAAQERFEALDAKPVSEAEARQIIGVIKSNGFCTKA